MRKRNKAKDSDSKYNCHKRNDLETRYASC